MAQENVLKIAEMFKSCGTKQPWITQDEAELVCREFISLYDQLKLRTEERDSARKGLFSHLTGEHALAEPTYIQLKPFYWRIEKSYTQDFMRQVRRLQAKLKDENDHRQGFEVIIKDLTSKLDTAERELDIAKEQVLIMSAQRVAVVEDSQS